MASSSSGGGATQCSGKKRKRVVLNIEQKLSILDRLKKGEAQERIARDFGVGRSTIGDFKKAEDKLRSFAATMENLDVSSKKRKVMRLAKDDRLDEALYLWFIQKRSQDMPVSGPILCEKATQLHEMLHKDDESTLEAPFNASRGWLWRFCQRHGIRQLSLQGEKLSSDGSVIEPFKAELQELLEHEQLTLDKVYNCDETGLCYRSLPNKTLAAKSEKDASNMKKQKDRVTIMACSNATGTHKLPLVMIGKSVNPRCFKHVNKRALPVQYSAQKSAWMDSHIFSQWFHHEFVPAVKRYQKEGDSQVKALLLLDNAPSHPDASSLISEDGNIKAFYLPPNTTPLIQPMDQGVLEALKRRYRKALLQKLLLEDEEGRSIVEFVKQINMKDIVYMIAGAWEDISSSTLRKSWNKLLSSEESINPSTVSPNEGNDEVVELAKQLDSNLEMDDISEWMTIDNDHAGHQLLSDEEIISEVSKTNEDEVIEDEQVNEDTSGIPTSGEAHDMLDKCLLWYERQEECNSTSLLLLKNIRDLAATKRYSNLKQLTLQSFVNN